MYAGTVSPSDPILAALTLSLRLSAAPLSPVPGPGAVPAGPAAGLGGGSGAPVVAGICSRKPFSDPMAASLLTAIATTIAPHRAAFKNFFKFIKNTPFIVKLSTKLRYTLLYYCQKSKRSGTDIMYT